MSGTLATRFRPRISAGSGFGVSPLSGFTPASGGLTGEGIVDAGALSGSAVDRLSGLAGLSGAPQYTTPPAAVGAAPQQPAPMMQPLWYAEGANVGDNGGMGGMGDAGGGYGSSGHSGGGDGVGGAGGDAGGDGQGWMGGGYTGPGHPAEPAGTVHKGEVVIPAHQVARYGLRPLMALVEGEVPASRLAMLARG